MNLPPQLMAIRINLLESSSSQNALGGLVVVVRNREDLLHDTILPGLFDQSSHSLGGDTFASVTGDVLTLTRTPLRVIRNRNPVMAVLVATSRV